MKTAKINRAFWTIVSTMSVHDVVNGYFGGYNLFAEYRNDYSESGAAFVAEWIEDNVNKPWWTNVDVDLAAIVESADNLMRECASEYASALAWIVDGDGELGEKLLSAPAWFDVWGNFYVFARPFSNACTEYWIIRADSEQSAIEELITRFEESFIVDDEESFIIDDEEAHEGYYINDNGNPCSVDGLVCIGEIVEGV